MVRLVQLGIVRPLRSPHARGDGPLNPIGFARMILFSPRPWGWSAHQTVVNGCLAVLPTPVGMVRNDAGNRSVHGRSPHARGDGPSLADICRWPLMFSPRPWGWSAQDWVDQGKPHVLPTPVGMVRFSRSVIYSPGSSPHARGDGPSHALAGVQRVLFSPRPWGWSVRGPRRALRAGVLPTPVGMVRPFEKPLVRVVGSPHARGDGPALSLVAKHNE